MSLLAQSSCTTAASGRGLLAREREHGDLELSAPCPHGDATPVRRRSVALARTGRQLCTGGLRGRLTGGPNSAAEHCRWPAIAVEWEAAWKNCDPNLLGHPVHHGRPLHDHASTRIYTTAVTPPSSSSDNNYYKRVDVLIRSGLPTDTNLG